MSQTENEATPPPTDGGEERIRKVYAKDLKNAEAVLPVFRATNKERHTSRAGKTYLSMTLIDRTGEVDARIFENVDVAETAVAEGDYLLVQGKVGSFHGKSQIVIDRLERLDPEPIDEKEFTFVKAPEPTPASDEKERPKKAEEAPRELKLPRRLQRMLSDPQLAQGLDALLGFIDRLVDEKVALRLGGAKAEPVERPEREKRPRGPRVEHKPPRTEGEKTEVAKPEPKRDPSLPEGLAFKPFNQLVGEPPGPGNNATPETSEG
jgi:hypothetical protein